MMPWPFNHRTDDPPPIEVRRARALRQQAIALTERIEEAATRLEEAMEDADRRRGERNGRHVPPA